MPVTEVQSCVHGAQITISSSLFSLLSKTWPGCYVMLCVYVVCLCCESERDR